MPSVQVKDIMTKDVLSVGPEDSLEYIASLFEKYDYDGLPVIDQDKKLVGIVTAYDMVVQSSGMHLPTVVEILDKISVNRADRRDLEGHFNQLRQVRVRQLMNSDPLTVKPDTAIEVLAKEFAQHHRVNPIPVVDDSGVLVGVVSRYDVIRFFNENYFHQVLKAAGNDRVLTGLQRSGMEQGVDRAVGSISKEFLLVTKKRPRIWRFLIIAAFVAGFLGATAFIIRIVRKPSQPELNQYQLEDIYNY